MEGCTSILFSGFSNDIVMTYHEEGEDNSDNIWFQNWKKVH